MRTKAEEELERRRLMGEAVEVLQRSDEQAHEEALSLFKQALQFNVYLSDIEDLCRERGELLRTSPRLTRRLCDLFSRAYRFKYDRDRYRHMPERMRAERRTHGLKTIRELFAAYALGGSDPSRASHEEG